MKEFKSIESTKEHIRKKPIKFEEDFEEIAFHTGDNKRRTMDKNKARKDKRVSLRNVDNASAD